MHNVTRYRTLTSNVHRTLLAVGITLLSAACARDEESSTVKPLQEFGITANNAFLYYDDLERATAFYTETLGIRLVADYGFAKILHVAPTSYLVLVDAAEGMHSTDEPKSVAMALITDQLDEWYSYLEARDVEWKYGYDPVEGRAHHGFVILDPEGYYLEFERFNEHPENEQLMPILAEAQTILAEPGPQAAAPTGLGFKATVLWMYYKDMERIQRFYQDKFGLELLVDQGWAKIYQTSPTGFIGLVDETRGMHSYSEQKAVTVSFFTDDLRGWYEYVRDSAAFELRSTELDEEGPRVKAFVGYDPEGYYLEFDTFLMHEDNEELLKTLQQ
jgi:catechol 2,3-dioxygenase-like lactoylglutathione lyase family enzyme